MGWRAEMKKRCMGIVKGCPAKSTSFTVSTVNATRTKVLHTGTHRHIYHITLIDDITLHNLSGTHAAYKFCTEEELR